MRRSKEIKLTLLASVALTLTACHDEHRDCVDSQNRMQPDSYCQDTNSHYYGGGYHYLYGGRSGGHIGDSVVGGNVSRGGFGGSFGSGGHFGGGE